jgi:hypothetical protein
MAVPSACCVPHVVAVWVVCFVVCVLTVLCWVLVLCSQPRWVVPSIRC